MKLFTLNKGCGTDHWSSVDFELTIIDPKNLLIPITGRNTTKYIRTNYEFRNKIYIISVNLRPCCTSTSHETEINVGGLTDSIILSLFGTYKCENPWLVVLLNIITGT